MSQHLHDLQTILNALKVANETQDGPIVDTIWMPGSPSETLFDWIQVRIDGLQVHTDMEQIAQDIVRDRFDRFETMTPECIDTIIESFVREGKLVTAIKLYRWRNGTALMESKRAIEVIASRLHAVVPLRWYR